MAIYGRFTVNNAKFSPLVITNIGTFLAFSGNNQFRNQGGCTAIPDNGPIPAGKYWIVDRPNGGVKSRITTWIKDKANNTNHSEWFALYRDDGLIDDYTWINGVERGNFRLHPIGGRGISLGCITLNHNDDYQFLREVLLATKKIKVPNTNLFSYGTIEVIAHAKNCPIPR